MLPPSLLASGSHKLEEVSEEVSEAVAKVLNPNP